MLVQEATGVSIFVLFISHKVRPAFWVNLSRFIFIEAPIQSLSFGCLILSDGPAEFSGQEKVIHRKFRDKAGFSTFSTDFTANRVLQKFRHTSCAAEFAAELDKRFLCNIFLE
jgi:hypothetical protein